MGSNLPDFTICSFYIYDSFINNNISYIAFMFLSKTRLKASELMEQAVVFLHNKYSSSAHVFTPASPFGQLLTVVSNIAELIFTYIAHTAEE